MSDTSERSRSPRTGQFERPERQPSGRRRKQMALPEAARSSLEIVVDKRVTVMQGGVDRVVVEEARQLRTHQDASAENRGAQRVILKMIIKREKAIGDRGQRIMPLITSKTDNLTLETQTPPCVF